MGDDDAVLRRAAAARSSTRWATCRSRRRRPRRLFQVITQRYLKGSICLTTNLGVGSWGKIFDDPMVAAAMLDRLLHRSVVFNIDGDSYRMREHRARSERLRSRRSRPKPEGRPMRPENAPPQMAQEARKPAGTSPGGQPGRSAT